MPSPQVPILERAEKIGRRAGFLALGLVVTGFTAVCAVQIISQAWFRPAGAGAGDCRGGLEQLIEALDRARHRVRRPGEVSEAQALQGFRDALGPQWQRYEVIAKACRSDALATKAVKQIEQLRYAEEHAVRYEAQNLLRHRRQLDETLAELGMSTSPEHLTSPDTNAHE